MKKQFAVCAIALALAACSAGKETAKTEMIRNDGDRVVLNEPDKADFLKTATVDRDQGSSLRLPGRLVWNETKTVHVYPQLAGRVLSAKVDLGQTVKSGQTLALLNSADYGAAQADARKAEADARLARQSLERSRELHAAGITAEKDWQQAQADAARASAEATRASQRLAALGGDGDGSYALKSPLAGVVVERNFNPGMEYRPDQSGPALFTVTDPSSLWLQLDAAEADLRYLKPGQKLGIEVKQYPGERFNGVISHVADFVDPTSRTIKVRCEVPNADRRLKGEMFAQAIIELPPTDALQVPATAVMLLGDQRVVLVEEDAGRYRRQRVETGVERDGRIEVISGVKAGDKVVTEGNLHLVKYFKVAAGAGK